MSVDGTLFNRRRGGVRQLVTICSVPCSLSNCFLSFVFLQVHTHVQYILSVYCTFTRGPPHLSVSLWDAEESYFVLGVLEIPVLNLRWGGGRDTV